MALSRTALANAIGVPPRRINEIVLGKRAITSDTDLRLACYFGMSEGLFLGLQADYELIQLRRQIGDKLKAIRPRAGVSLASPQLTLRFGTSSALRTPSGSRAITVRYARAA